MKKFIAFYFLLLSTLALAENKATLKFEVETKEINNLVINIKGHENNEAIKKKEVKSNKVKYLIKKGDTLANIALKYKSSIKKIMKNNKIKNRALIYAGDYLELDVSEDTNEKN